uniref:NADH-ubiquinone oxidoreductase chain 2 n=1 Tax=Polydactylus plebeius TaxID=392546 RepID=A0A0B6VI65_9TELE|nr:NADH dehydrogenase subunit 2 [Polydactylus plebeius]BAQ20917.1 NADH dehydrogenase subunit 2 [Polydactylus plebeius]
MVHPLVIYSLLFLVGLGTAIVFTSSNLLLAWMGLELNMLAMLPLMMQHRHPRAVEATTKYFIIQATAAAVFLFAALVNIWYSYQWNSFHFLHPFTSTLCFCALAMKIGLAPFHAWVPEVLQALELPTAMILATWQKLAPFAVLIQLLPHNPNLLVLLGLISMLVGGWGGMTQTQLRKLLAYSSIGHLGWMILALNYFPLLTLAVLLIYISVAVPVFLLLMINKSTSINMLSTSWSRTSFTISIAAILFLSLAGLPPLTGFVPKLLVVSELVQQGYLTPALLALLVTLLSLTYYLRLLYAMASTISPNNVASLLPWRIHPTRLSLPLAVTSVIAISAIPLLPAAYMLTQ